VKSQVWGRQLGVVLSGKRQGGAGKRGRRESGKEESRRRSWEGRKENEGKREGGENGDARAQTEASEMLPLESLN